jgi:outer membrane lipoprotein-sorting protein
MKTLYGEMFMNILRLKLLFFMSCFALLLVFEPGCTILDDENEAFEQPADISKQQLFDRMLATSDPTGVYRKAKSYILRQEQELSGSSKKSYFIIEIKFKRPDKIKVTTLKARKPIRAMIFNGDKAWQINYEAEKYTVLEGLAFKRAKLFFSMGQPGNQYSSIFPEVKLTEWIKGPEQYYKLVCNAKVKGISPITIFVGKNNFLTKRLELTLEIASGQNEPYVSIMDRYALYEGVMVASLSTVEFMGKKTKYGMIDYQLNVDIADSEFQPPVWQ